MKQPLLFNAVSYLLPLLHLARFSLQIAVMHAYIDQENYSDLTIDAALRELLKGFRLPGLPQLKAF